MVYILTSYADNGKDGGTIGHASSSHDLLLSVLGSGTLDAIMKDSLADFVVQLLTRMYDTFEGTSHLAKYAG